MSSNIESKLSYNRLGSPSLKSTIPQAIVHFLSLESGDTIYWETEIIDGERVAIVRKKTHDLD